MDEKKREKFKFNILDNNPPGLIYRKSDGRSDKWFKG